VDLPYRVSWSRKVIDALKDFGENAHQSGVGEELVRLLRIIDERLRREPIDLGEVYRSRGAIEEHLAVRGFVAIDFAVDKERRFVLVRHFHILHRFAALFHRSASSTLISSGPETLLTITPAGFLFFE
jgi:hypothetical protein